MNSLINEYVLSKDSTGNYIEGILVKISDRFFIRNIVENVIDDVYIGFTDIYTLVNPICCAKKLGELPNKVGIFDYDVFKTQDGAYFYVSFDFSKLSIVYYTEKDKTLPSNLNLFTCQRVGNIKMDDPSLFVNDNGEFIFE